MTDFEERTLALVADFCAERSESVADAAGQQGRVDGGGYNTDLFVDKARAEPFECAVCLDVVRRATGTECGHMFCDTCIRACASSGAHLVCPLCRADVDPDGLSPLAAIDRIVQQMRVRCPLCSWEGELMLMDAHRCAITMVKCCVCEESVELGAMSAHVRADFYRHLFAYIRSEHPSAREHLALKHTLRITSEHIGILSRGIAFEKVRGNSFGVSSLISVSATEKVRRQLAEIGAPSGPSEASDEELVGIEQNASDGTMTLRTANGKEFRLRVAKNCDAEISSSTDAFPKQEQDRMCLLQNNSEMGRNPAGGTRFFASALPSKLRELVEKLLKLGVDDKVIDDVIHRHTRAALGTLDRECVAASSSSAAAAAAAPVGEDEDRAWRQDALCTGSKPACPPPPSPPSVIAPGEYTAERCSRMVTDSIFFYATISMCYMCGRAWFPVCARHSASLSKVLHPRLGVFSCRVPNCDRCTLNDVCTEGCDRNAQQTLLCVFSVSGAAAIMHQTKTFEDHFKSAIVSRCKQCYATSIRRVGRSRRILAHCTQPAVQLEGYNDGNVIHSYGVSVKHCIEGCQGKIEVSLCKMRRKSLRAWVRSFESSFIDDAGKCQ